MDYLVAEIQWVSSCDGGRHKLPSPGSMYYPHIALECGYPNNSSWSVSIKMPDAVNMCSSIINFQMLVNNRYTYAFFSKLKIDDRFLLLEGKRIVAKGRIIGFCSE